MAIKYIKHLQYLLSYPAHQKIPSHIVEFDPAHPAWVKAGSGLHPHLMTHSPTFEGPSPHIIDMDLEGIDTHLAKIVKNRPRKTCQYKEKDDP